MAFQLLYFRLIDVSLYVVAEIREEKYFSFAVPEIRMVNDIFEHEFSWILGNWASLYIFLYFAFCLIYHKIEELQVLILTISLIFKFLV